MARRSYCVSPRGMWWSRAVRPSSPGRWGLPAASRRPTLALQEPRCHVQIAHAGGTPGA
ncbi:hypothetical protein T484DRAFT_1979702, partial [Baffinella frigidus]